MSCLFLKCDDFIDWMFNNWLNGFKSLKFTCPSWRSLSSEKCKHMGGTFLPQVLVVVAWMLWSTRMTPPTRLMPEAATHTQKTTLGKRLSLWNVLTSSQVMFWIWHSEVWGCNCHSPGDGVNDGVSKKNKSVNDGVFKKDKSSGWWCPWWCLQEEQESKWCQWWCLQEEQELKWWQEEWWCPQEEEEQELCWPRCIHLQWHNKAKLSVLINFSDLEFHHIFGGGEVRCIGFHFVCAWPQGDDGVKDDGINGTEG